MMCLNCLRCERPARAGFTLIELLVVVAILSVLACLLLPALQSSREEDRRAQCTDNLRKILVGFQNHHDSYNGLPPVRTMEPGHHGWCVNLLPFMEQKPLYDAFNLGKNFYDFENQTVSHTALQVFVCPSSPGGIREVDMGMGAELYGTKAIVGDYKANHILNPMYQANGKAGNPVLLREGGLQPIGAVTDGTSQTSLIHEQAGRNDWYLRGHAKQPTNSGLTSAHWWAAWTSYQHFMYQGYTADGKALGWQCSMNCNNGQGIYSFHPGGTNVGFCDGSVRFVKETIPVTLVFALATRDGGEVLAPDDY